MKVCLQFLLLPLLCLSLFNGCQKEAFESTSLVGDPPVELSAEIPEETILSRRALEEGTPCGDLSPFDNHVSIIWGLDIGGSSDAICYTEQELLLALINSGMSTTAANEIVQRVFHTDDGITLASLYDMVLNIETLPDGSPLPSNFIPDCYFISAFNPGAYSVPAPEPHEPHSNECLPGDISLIISSAFFPESACPGSGAFSGQLRIANICASTSSTINLNINPGGNIWQALLASGMTPAEASQILSDITTGQLSPRDFWNLFQIKIVPHLSELDLLYSTLDELASCLRLSQIILTTTSANNHFSTYWINGLGRLYCGPLL